MVYSPVTPQARSAPKIQSNNMAPRQQAQQRMLRAPAKKKKAKARKRKNRVPGVKKYLAGDDVYQNTISQLRNSFQNFRDEQQFNRESTKDDFATILKRLGLQQEEDSQSLNNDFAARGLFGSGLFLDADKTLQRQFSDQRTDAELANQRNLEMLDLDLEAAKTQQRAERQNARLNAIRRRAQEYGITGGPSVGKRKKKKNKKKGKK